MLQGSENVVLVEYGLKLGCEEGKELVSLDSPFEGEIYDNFEGGNTVSGIKYGKIQVPEGEVMGNTYVSGQISRFGD